ncbi:MAG: hypothetical protein V3T44_03030 [bacterium]
MSTGREIVAAVAKGTTWGTPLAAGALDGLLITGEGMGAGAPEDLVSEEAGVGWQQTSEAGDINIEGALSGFLRYESALWRLIALGLGTDASAVIDTSAYTHTMDFLDTLSALFGTLAIDKGPEVWEFPSAKVIGFSISGEAGQPVNFGITARCDALNRNTSGGTNNNTTMASVTYRSKALRVLFQHLTFRINAQSAGALASPTDDLQISSFNLSVTRPQSADHVSGQQGIIEPVEDGLPVVTLEFAIPEYAGATHLDRMVAHTALKADLTFDSGVLAGAATQNYDAVISIPQLILTADEAAVAAAAKIPESISGRCEEAQTAPSGMTGITKPFRLVVHNKQSAAEI